jgi:membrane-associated protease RseP (regulator of RpoE activity)
MAVALASMACSAVYPEMKTAVRAVPEGVEPDPAPSAEMYHVYFDGAWIPPKDQGGRRWPGGAPDPFAKLIVNDVDVIVTPVQSRSREPTWPNQDKENIHVAVGSKVFIEIWDNNAMTNLPICRTRVRDIDAIREGADNEFWCDSGARVMLHVEQAKAVLGVGLYYETRGGNDVRVTRVITDSPAARAGLGPGDRILAIQGKSVAQMDALQVRGAINLNARSGLELDIWFKNGKRHLVTLKEGAIYPQKGDSLKLSK